MHGYVRVSRRNGRGGDRYISPDEQERAVREAAARIGVELVDVVVEEDVSGSLPAEKRRLGEVLVACEQGRSDGVIVSNVDRLTRASKLDEAVIFERLSRAGARFVAANESIDTDQPGADLTLDIMAAIARQQWRRYRENWSNAKRNAVERGVHIGRVPFGYLRDEDGRLAPHPEQASAVHETFVMRGAGASWNDICARLEELGHVPGAKRGWGTSDSGSRWIAASVRRMLRNEVYLGVAYHGELRNPDAHEAIVTRAEFAAAQVRRPGRVARGGEGTRLAGLVHCAGCGRRMTPSRTKGAYRCLPRRHNDEPCTSRAYLRMDEGDLHVVTKFLERYTALVDRGGRPTPELRPLERKLELARDAKEALLADTEWLASLTSEERGTAVESARRKVDEAQRALDEAGVASMRDDAIVDIVQDFDLFYDPGDPSKVGTFRGQTSEEWVEATSLTIPQQRQLLSRGIERVEVAKGRRHDLEKRVRIVWVGES